MQAVADHFLGRFKIGRRVVLGDVHLRGRNTSLKLSSNQAMNLLGDERHVLGTSNNGEKISCCDCREVSSSMGHNAELTLFPHFVVIGVHHLRADKAEISEISFTTDGAISIFYDPDLFGIQHLRTSAEIQTKLGPALKKPSAQRAVVIFSFHEPHIIETSDKEKVTSVSYLVSYQWPTPYGTKLDNEARIFLRFKHPQTLTDSLDRMRRVISFLEMIAQSKQVASRIELRIRKSKRSESSLRLTESFAERAEEREQPLDFRDCLIRGATDRDAFERIFSVWADSDGTMRSARQRFIEGFREPIYTIDRLVGAANAFDLLPNGLFGKKTISAKTKKILSTLKSIAKNIDEPARSQLISNIGRTTGHTLRDKIVTRYDALPEELRSYFPDMHRVIDHCVRLRNFYVHGSRPRLSPQGADEFMPFLTDVLEFIFVFSDLQNCGWDYKSWRESVGYGQFKFFLAGYSSHEQRLFAAEGYRV